MPDPTTQTTQDQQPQSTVPMFSPDGTLGDVPTERVPDAVKSGFKMGHDLVAPNGQLGTVPLEKVHDALSSGFKLPAPIKGSVPGAPEGLPGVPATPSPMQTLTTPSTVASQAWGAVKSHVPQVVEGAILPVMTDIHTSLDPPANAREHAIAAVGGPGALIAYRSGKRIVDGAENLFKARQQDYQQAKTDFARIADEYHNGDYRNALATAGDIASDIGGRNAEVVRGREISEGSRQGGDIVTPITKDAIDALALLIGKKSVEEAAPAKIMETAGEVAGKVKEVPGKIADATPDMFSKRPPTPEPMHGAPVRAESPLDSATVGRQLGGKDLSQPALDALQQHVTDKIPVGGTAKGQLMKAVEPTQRVINETATKMNQTVQDAPPFTTSVAQDSVFGEGSLSSDLEAMKKNLAQPELGKTVDKVMTDNAAALNSNNPAEVLEARRKLGNLIDWDAIEKNPDTPAEVQNAARARVYRALGDKIHTEIPETVKLDKTLQPQLELRSHMRRKLGDRVVDDPHAATAEAQSELNKGKIKIDNELHNEKVSRNIKVALGALSALGLYEAKDIQKWAASLF